MATNTDNMSSSTICGPWSWFCKGDQDNEDILLPIILLAVSVTILGTCLFQWGFKKQRETADKLPPGPRGLPIVGYLPFLGPNLHQLFMELALTYGPIYKLSIGRKLCVIISSPALVKEVVRDQDTTFANRNPTIAAKTFSYGGKDIAFQPYGPEWRMLRKIFVREMQSNANLDAFYSLRRNKVKESVNETYRKIGKPVNIGELAFSTVINMISGMFWGGTLEVDTEIDIGSKFRAAASELIEILGKPNVSDFFPVLARFDIQGIERKMKKATQRIEKIYDFVMDEWIEKGSARVESEAKNDQRKDFMHFLFGFKEQDSGRSISREQIKALLMDIVVGGTDTTSTTVEWAMAEMMLHPQVMKNAQKELTDAVGTDEIVEERHIDKLQFLHAVVKETLRLHPVAPLLLPRSPSNTCCVGGYTIPRNAKVFLNVWAIHRDPKFWDNPSEFQPERFLRNVSRLDYLGNNMQYLPFGSGRRICAGLPLGERMLMYCLATFLHMFKWELPNGERADTSEKFGVVLEKSTPLIAIPTPRLSNLNLYA